MRRLCLAAALMLCTATAQAGDPLSAAQEVQALQSALAILGHDPGPVDGIMGRQTRAALEAFKDATGFEAAGADPELALMNAVLDATGPALAERFGTDPTGFWDIDWEASGLDPLADGVATCADGGKWYFSGGIIWRLVDSGVPIVMTLNGDHLETLPIPSGGFIEPNRFVSVDPNTMHRLVEGEAEVWSRCDPGPAPTGE